MALPIRRAAPQPRPKPVRPQRITPAPLGSPQAKPTFAIRGKFWIPRLPRPPLKSSRRVVPAPVVAAPPPPATLALQGIRRFIVRVVIKASRMVRPAPLASPQAPGLFAQGVRRGPTKNNQTRLVRPAPLASPQAAGVQVRAHIWTPRPRITASRRVVPAPSVAASAVPATFALQGVKRPTGKPPRARLIVAPSADPQAPSIRRTRGVVRPPTKNRSSRLFAGIPPTIAQPTPTAALHGARWARIKPGSSRRVLPAPAAAPQASSTQVAGIRRGPVRNNRSRLYVGIAPSVAAAAAIVPLHGARWAPTRIARSRRIAPAPLAAPQASPTFATAGNRRIHPKRAPQARLFVAPVGVAPITSIMVVVYVPKTNGSYGIVSWATKVQTFYEVSPLDGGGGTVLVNSDDVARFVRKVAGSRVLDPLESEHWRLTKPYVPEQGDDRNWRAGDG